MRKKNNIFFLYEAKLINFRLDTNKLLIGDNFICENKKKKDESRKLL